MAVARDNLGRHRFGRKTHRLGDMFLDRRVDISERSHRPGNCAGGNFSAGRFEPRPIASKLGVIPREFRPEGHRLGMNAVAASDGRRKFVFLGTCLERRQQPINVFQQNIRCLA